MLDYFNALESNVWKLSFEGFYVTRMLCFEKISCGKFILLEDVGLMTFFLYFERFYVIGRFRFYEISLIFLGSIFMTSKIHKQKF